MTLDDLILPDKVLARVRQSLAALARAQTVTDALLANERAQGVVEGLEVAGALNPRDIEQLFILLDEALAARLTQWPGLA